MKVDNILILAAGKGTRMGDIGKDLPKVLWPLFDKSLLEWQVLYAKFLFPNANIHINIFNYKEKILKYIADNPKIFENVNIVEEHEELDVGGAIQNVANILDYLGKLLILNGDQFLFFSNDLKKISIANNENIMMSYEVSSSDGYNALGLENGYFERVILNKDLEKDKTIITYTGMSIIELSSLKKKQGKSKFFNTVISVEHNKTKVQKLNDLEYWDFGTIERYISSINRLMVTESSEFLVFLKRFSEEIDISRKVYLDNGVIEFKNIQIHKDKAIFLGF